MDHILDSSLLTRRVRVDLIGVGGAGAQMAAALARLNVALLALGHPHGLHVRAFDGGHVTPANVGRQVYSPSDVGHNKAELTVHRLNQFYGLNWTAHASHLQPFLTCDDWNPPDILISCVDTRAARAWLHHTLWRCGGRCFYWLDLGNEESSGQALLGQPQGVKPAPGAGPRLPCVTELFPELLDSKIAEDNRPSCSVRMSLSSQGLFVNDLAVRYGAQLLYELFSNGRLLQHGVIFNMADKRSAALPVDPEAWARYGYVA